MNGQGMDQRRGKGADRDPVHMAAADWFARLREPDLSLEETMAWQSWMSADARHAEAFARIEAVSSVLHDMPRPPLPPPSDDSDDHYDASVPLSLWRKTASSPRTLSRKRKTMWTGAIAASLVVASAALGWAALNKDSLGWPSSKANVLETAVGENRTVTLGDGSRVTLGGATMLRVLLSDHLRQIEISRGEAFFSVAKDASKPFKVNAGDARVVALGTEFNVRRGGDRIVVSVVEGRVVVEPVSRFVPMALLRGFNPRLVPVKVSAGEQTVAGDAGVADAVPLADVTATTGWQMGRLAFRGQPLRYVLEDVNRYAPKPIVIEDERIGARLFTGTLMGNNVRGGIGSLERAFNLEAVEMPDRIVLRAAQRP